MHLEANYIYSAEEFSAPFKIVLWKLQKRVRIFSFISGAAIIALGLSRFLSGERQTVIDGVLVAMGVYLVLSGWFRHWLSMRQLTKSAAHGLKAQIILTDEGLSVKTEGQNSEMNWALVHRVVIENRGALIFANQRTFNWFPFDKAEPEDAREQLISLLERQGVTVKVL